MGTENASEFMSQPGHEGLWKGLSWLQTNLTEFSIKSRFDIDSQNLKDQIPLLKPISELALTIWILQRCGFRNNVIAEIATWIWDEISAGGLITSLLLARNDFLPCCSLCAPLYQLGYRSAPLMGVLGLLSRSDMAKALPLSPWGVLAMRYNLGLMGFETVSTNELGLYVRAFPEPWVVSGEVAYAITHEVFYLTDFGFRDLPDAKLKDYLRLWIPYWITIFEEEGDYDLAGEFAMAWSCLNLGKALSVEHVLQKIQTVQREFGCVSGPVGAGSILHRRGDSAERRSFLATYHTTLVALMAYGLALREP